MAVFAFTDASITINAVDLSDHISRARIGASVVELNDTAFGDTWESLLGGLKSFAVDFNFHQDFAASEVDATLWPLLGTLTTVVIKPTSGAVSATNPSFTGSLLVSDYKPLDGQVGDLAQVSIAWPGSGALTRATS